MHWMTRVEVYGQIMSPLYWAIRDGKFAIAQFMLQDLLAIRADRESYYYGREHLWETHPDVISVLCADCPMLVEDLQDGLLWHSQHVQDGKVRANYYIKELYSDPSEIKDAWKSPLAVMCLQGQPGMFMHPVANKLLQLKWMGFGKRLFLRVQFYFLIVLALYTQGFLVNEGECNNNAVATRLASGALAALAWCCMTYWIIYQYWAGQTTTIGRGRLKFTIPRLLFNPWNLARYTAMMCLIVISFSVVCVLPATGVWWWDGIVQASSMQSILKANATSTRGALHYSSLSNATVTDSGIDLVSNGAFAKAAALGLHGSVGIADTLRRAAAAAPHEIDLMMVLSAITALLMWGQLVQLLIISTRLAALTYTIGQLFGDVVRFIILMGIILVSFAAAMTALQVCMCVNVCLSVCIYIHIYMHVCLSTGFSSSWGSYWYHLLLP
jgi:hypothetical protein